MTPGGYEFAGGSGASQGSDPFRLHYTRGGQRCVAGYDTLEDAVESALGRLQKNPRLDIWVSDGGRRVILSRAQLLERLIPPPNSSVPRTEDGMVPPDGAVTPG